MVAGNKIKLDLWGAKPRDGWQSVAPGPGFDYGALLAALSLMPDGCATEIHAWHILNKLTADRQVAFLRECHRLLQPHGLFAGAVPDMDVLCRLFVSLPDPATRMTIATLIYGDHATPSRVNHAGFNADLIVVALGAGGFATVTLPAEPHLPGQPLTVIDEIPVDLHFVARS